MIRVGIVEDKANIRTLITKFLDMQSDFEPVAAYESVELMLEYLKNHKLDVILMDIQLPGMSGIEGIKIIKKRL